MNRLIAKARAARRHAYAPYSRFKVGAAVECGDGRVFTGCNVENASYGATCCAERTALFKAVSEGARAIRKIAVVADMPEPCPPCGICRQAISELAPKATVIMANLRGKVEVHSIAELLPAAFHKLKKRLAR